MQSTIRQCYCCGTDKPYCAPGEGEIPNEAKTGTGPILLTCSFPYVRDWLSEHPFKNEPNARLICNRYTGGAINPEAMWSMMKYLRLRIMSLIKQGSVTNKEAAESFLSYSKKFCNCSCM
jgi:integrase/recombinase XerD